MKTLATMESFNCFYCRALRQLLSNSTSSIRIELDFDPAISGMIRPHETEHLLSIADGYQRSRNDIDCIIALVVPQNLLDPYQRFFQEQISSISFARYKAKWFIEARGGGNGKLNDCFFD